jgi:hypothetical protein
MQKCWLVGTLVVLLVAMVAGLVTLSPSSVYAQESAVQPGVGAPGTTFAFFATGFDSEQVGYWLNAPNGEVITTDEKVNTNDGRADWNWEAPDDAMVGVWQMVARGEESDVERIIPFEIRLGAPATGPSGQPIENPDYAVEPVIGSPGTQFSFYARGFEDGEKVGYWLNAPDGRVVSTDEQATVNNDSRADWDWTSPSDAMVGVWQMVVRGVESDRQVVIQFEIR